MPEPSTDLAAEPSPEQLTAVGSYASHQEGWGHGLVVLSMGHPYWLEAYDAGWRLLVEPPCAEDVRAQLALFDRESAHWPPQVPIPREHTATRPLFGPLLWCFSLIAVFQLQLRWPGRLEERGLLDPHALFQKGELWRPFTALFLHADAAHLTANLVSGFFIVSLVLSAFGRVRGALLLTVAAMLGNSLVAAAHVFGTYHSLGASTAIFAGLGALTGRAVRVALSSHAPKRWTPVFLPLAAGLTLLGLFGAGAPQTDVAAHAAGFLCGLGMGGIFGKTPLK